MNGLVKSYKVSNSATIVTLKERGSDKIKKITIPVHGIVDISYTKGDSNVGFQEVTTNTKTLQFDNPEKAEDFFIKINGNWFGIA